MVRRAIKRKDLPEEINDVVETLTNLENLPLAYHRRRAEDFEQAIEALNQYLKENTASPYSKYIENIKLTYTRWLLEQLPKHSIISFYEWIPYLMPVLFNAQKEIDIVMKRFQKLGKNYRHFLTIWKDELIREIHKSKESAEGKEALIEIIEELTKDGGVDT